MKITRRQLRRLIQEEIEKQSTINEAAIVLTTGILLALPKILVGIGKLLDRIGKKHDEEFKQHHKERKIEVIGHKIHKLYFKALRVIVKRVVTSNAKVSDEQVDKLTEVLFSVLLASLMISSGVGAAHAVHEAHTGLAILEGSLGAVKGKELSEIAAAFKDPKVAEKMGKEIEKHV